MTQEQAKVTCLVCLWTRVKNCSLGYKAEKDFYLNYRPTCSRCGSRGWKIEEILEVIPPLNENEKELFSLSKHEDEAKVS